MGSPSDGQRFHQLGDEQRDRINWQSSSAFNLKSCRCSRPLRRNPIARRFQLLAELLRDLARAKMHCRELHIPLRPMSKERPREFPGPVAAIHEPQLQALDAGRGRDHRRVVDWSAA